LIGISVRQLRNWETDRRRARIENLHDLSEATGIPMQVCVALNADQPIWYSLQKRRFAYSSIETQSYSDELYKFHEELGDKFIVKAERISKDKHINMILSYHQEVYHTIKPLRKNVVEAAAKILPDLNHIIFDSWGHYVGHIIFLPLGLDVYRKLKVQKYFERYLSREKISDIVALNEGVFLNYSSFAASINASHQNIISVAQFFTKIKQKERYMVSGYSPVEEAHELFKKNGMRLIRDYQDKGSKIYCKLYEAKLDAVMRPKQPLWNLLSTIQQHNAFPDKLIEKVKQNRSMDKIFQEPDNDSSKFENYPGEKLPGYDSLNHDMPLSAGELPLSADNKKYDVKDKSKFQIYCFKKETCQNPECILHNITGKGNIISCGTYRTKAGVVSRRFICKECGKSFSHRTAGIFYSLYGLRSPEEKILKAFKHLVKGMPLQSVAKIIGIRSQTVQHWLKVISKQSGKIDALLEKELKVSSAELATLWTFVRKNALRQRAALYNWNNYKGN
jgi:transposase-like protein/transcriptional regulator with XRE-family HTH domain